MTVQKKSLELRDIIAIVVGVLNIIGFVGTIAVFGTKLSNAIENTNTTLTKVSTAVESLNTWRNSMDKNFDVHKERNYNDLSGINGIVRDHTGKGIHVSTRPSTDRGE